MSSYRLTLYEDSFTPGAWAEFLTGGANRILFCAQGSLGLGELGSVQRQEAEVCIGATHVTTGHDGALVWRWELTHDDEPEEIEGAGVTSRVLTASDIPMHTGSDYLFRCESMGLPPADALPAHRLMGPSMAVCMQGMFTCDRGGTITRHQQFDAWYDDGDEKTAYEAHKEQPSLLLRAVLLSPLQKGGTSSVLVDAPEPPEGKRRFDKVITERIIGL